LLQQVRTTGVMQQRLSRLQSTLTDPSDTKTSDTNPSANTDAAKLLKPSTSTSPSKTSPSKEVQLEQLQQGSVKALALACAQLDVRPLLHLVITPDAQSAQMMANELNALLADNATTADILAVYPNEVFSPYELAVYPVQALKAQLTILHRLQKRQPCLLICSAKNLVSRQLSLQERQDHALTLTVGQDTPLEGLIQHVQDGGYLRVDLVMDPGEFSSRGDIFDIYPINHPPVRIEFFGDSVESIRIIDTENQRSIQSLEDVTIIPRGGIVLNEANRQALPGLLQDYLNKQTSALSTVEAESLATTLDNQLSALSQQFLPDGIDYYAPLIHQRFDNLLDWINTYYTPDQVLVSYDDWSDIAHSVLETALRYDREHKDGIQKGRLLNIGFTWHYSSQQIFDQLKAYTAKLYVNTFQLDTDSLQPLLPEDTQLTVEGATRFKADLRLATETFQRLRREGLQVFVSTDSPQRVLDICKEWDVPALFWPEHGLDADAASWLAGNEILIGKHGLHDGFILPQLKVAHFTDTELFGRRLKKWTGYEAGTQRQRENIDVINAIDDLRQGDYLVHVKHGIGRFIELTRIVMDGETREYLTLQYSGSDRLHVPVEQVNLLSRYRGAGDVAPKLSKMGGMEWSSVKKKVKKSIQNIAQELVRLYAQRAKVQGTVFEPDTPWQVEMEEAFPYQETPDQWQAIVDTKADMESPKVMDRLICGDVGYGKTEVAVRAIFKAVVSGKQVAVLVPTTILAQQHFNTLTDRFKPYPVRIGLLSRFRSPKEQKEVVNRLTLGECDVVVGTHRILQKDVAFRSLGLVVIDEEQRFGVSHKEKLKQLRTEVDVLTLSATPIPRTLYMAISGVREMSLINTPPVNRAPIKTFVGPYNPSQIRMAILHEVDRGGQVYFLHNRVQTIYAMAQTLRDLIPEVTFDVAHGQLPEGELENKMLGFSQRDFDVLVCTTIIESGVDIPNVNTIVIDRSDRFGLAQLYQIRGRVGRGPIQAYAYCYYEPEKQLTEDAKVRLKAIREFTTLGSGYQIAMRDLEIRGVGNVLGSEQHGHMISVGFDMYTQMLEESIEEVKGITVETKEDSIIDLNVTALIPDKWVGSRDVKLHEYKRLANARSVRELDIIQSEWKDRFGDIPAQTQTLVTLASLRIMATELAIPLVRGDDEAIRITVPFTLQEWMRYQGQLPKEVGPKARWMPGVSAKQGSNPVLVVKSLGWSGQDQVTYVLKLFTGLSTIRAKLMATAG
jgi:transcription-repair coupling factor (superfamily II helicase)